MSSKNIEISIFEINESLFIRKNLDSKNISLEANSFGTGRKILVAILGSQLIVKKVYNILISVISALFN